LAIEHARAHTVSKPWGVVDLHPWINSRHGRRAIGEIWYERAGTDAAADIAGAGNFVAPQATADAVLPAFLFLAGCGLAVGLASTFIPIETHGKPLRLGYEKY
jgi:hypothetical protein